MGICGLIQVGYSSLYAEHDWPALAQSLPEGNLVAETPVPNKDEHVKEFAGKRWFKCDSEYHLANSPTYLYFKHRNGRGNDSNGVGNGRGRVHGSNEGSNGNINKTNSTFDAWKYIHPADENQKLTNPDGKVCNFCKHCKFRKTDKVWFKNLSHVSKDHVSNYNPRQNNGNNANTGPNINLTGVNNASMNNEPPRVPPSTYVTVDDEADELTFVGGWVAAVYDPEESIWTLKI